LAEADVTPTGPPWLRYLDTSGDQWALEAAVPVATDAVAPDGVGRVEVAATRAAVAVHRGPYRGLRAAFDELGRWLDQQGHRVAGPLVDVYLNDPSKVEPADYETEIRIPIQDDT
jgi:AraC family transcriptional regulator